MTNLIFTFAFALCLSLLFIKPKRVCAQEAPVSIRSFQPTVGVCRAQRATTLEAVLVNNANSATTVEYKLSLPAGIRLLKGQPGARISLKQVITKLNWLIEAASEGVYDMKLEAFVSGRLVASYPLQLRFLQPMAVKKLPYIPEPEPVKHKLLIGAHNCPLWEHDKPEMWKQLLKHPERTPALGFYSQENPQIADWETKWCAEHGVDYFIYCWYRSSQGEAVKQKFGSAIHDALYHSRYEKYMKFTIMWENQSVGSSGVSDEKDLMNNLMPFWIDNYFKRDSYLKIDNKPVLYIYRPENLIIDLGGIENVPKAFDKMRQACVKAGFDGLYILGEYRGLDPNHLKLMKQLGLDYTFAYCWGIQDSPKPDVVVDTQMRYIKATQELGIIPQVVTVSQAWSGWADEGSIWKLPPADFERLLRQAKDFIATLPQNELGSHMLILDNWNEWGEGHYIAPYREYGFGYLDAVRNVFSDAPKEHIDLLPEDIGMGPYDLDYKAYTKRQDSLTEQLGKSVTKKGADEKGLTGWWTFDESKNAPYVLDYSGHRMGGYLYETTRTKGWDGNALNCQGGCAVIANNALLAPQTGLSFSMWVYTDKANQSDRWMLNRILSGRLDTGYRLGLSDGHVTFAMPLTEWSHHVSTSRLLPVGKWVYLAVTYDNRTIRIYIDGVESASLERGGPVKGNDLNLCIGNFDPGHRAFFQGKIDEVKLYNRALSPAELRRHAAEKPPVAK
ncbi:MAG: LamG-like jellyroll fold domain-containing protein [Armatimonadota bacterium]